MGDRVSGERSAVHSVSGGGPAVQIARVPVFRGAPARLRAFITRARLASVRSFQEHGSRVSDHHTFASSHVRGHRGPYYMDCLSLRLPLSLSLSPHGHPSSSARTSLFPPAPPTSRCPSAALCCSLLLPAALCCSLSPRCSSHFPLPSLHHPSPYSPPPPLIIIIIILTFCLHLSSASLFLHPPPVHGRLHP